MPKLLIIGLDCVAPELVFDRWLDDLPNIRGVLERGVHGTLWSTVPPITVPAWTAMMSSQDPGALGIYGFRNRSGYGYDDLFFANANYVKAKTVWNHLSRNRLKSLVFGVPQTYPPKPLNGIMVSSFLTPNKEVQFTHPAEVQVELDAVADGDYIIDVRDFRTNDKDRLLKDIYVMTERRFKAFRHFYGKEEPDFAIMVEMGTDRIHHGFWRYMAREHRLYTPGNPYEDVIHDYYVYVDGEIGRTLELVEDETSVMIVSDHGAKTMAGAICVNEWLQEKGYLTLKEQPPEMTRINNSMIDWSRTRVWGDGGYYARIFLNVAGREPEGIIAADEVEPFRDQLAAELEAITDDVGRPIGTRVLKPEDVYRQINGTPPDLIVYFGDLSWRSAGSVGVGSVHLFENDTGPDDANHAENGMFIWHVPGSPLKGTREASIYDIAPSILRFFGVEVPGEMIGKSLL